MADAIFRAFCLLYLLGALVTFTVVSFGVRLDGNLSDIWKPLAYSIGWLLLLIWAGLRVSAVSRRRRAIDRLLRLDRSQASSATQQVIDLVQPPAPEPPVAAD